MAALALILAAPASRANMRAFTLVAVQNGATSGAPNGTTGHSAGEAVTDEVGRRVNVPAEVKRIVTLSPDLTETVYALGLGDRLVGDTNFCDTPAEAKSKPHVGNPQNPSLEAIAGLRPDLVLASGSINFESTVAALERLGIPVYTSDPHTVNAMLDSVARMSDLMGAGAQGREVVAQLRQRLEAIHAKLADRPMSHVLFVVWQQPLMSISQKTFIADALRWAGAESIIQSDINWPQVSLEEVVRLQPEYLIFTSDHEVAGEGAADLEDLRTRPVWRDLHAVQLGHVVNVEEAIARPSPGLVGAIERLAARLHPDAFASASVNTEPNTEPVSHFHAAPLWTLSAVLPVPLCEWAEQEASPCAR